MQESTFDELESLFLALGDMTRLKLLALMADGPVAVGILAERLNESQPKVSRHLAYLRNAGIVTTRRDGKWIYYGIDVPTDPATRRILDTVVGSIAVMRIDGTDAYFTETTNGGEEMAGAEDNIYAQTYETKSDYDWPEVEVEGNERGSLEDNEMDVFLL